MYQCDDSVVGHDSRGTSALSLFLAVVGTFFRIVIVTKVKRLLNCKQVVQRKQRFTTLVCCFCCLRVGCVRVCVCAGACVCVSCVCLDRRAGSPFCVGERKLIKLGAKQWWGLGVKRPERARPIRADFHCCCSCNIGSLIPI